jgi:signal transduction histidine kinase
VNPHLQAILHLIQQTQTATGAEREAIADAVKEMEKALALTEWKLEQSEKANKATAVLLKQTKLELEQLRTTVMAQNLELEIEASLERVRREAMAMKKPDDLLGICKMLFEALLTLGFSELRNTMINIYNDGKEYFVNYDFSIDGGLNRLVIPYNSHPMIEEFVSQLKQASGGFTEHAKSGARLEQWKAYRESSGEQTSLKLKNATALYYYTYSFSNATIGISNFEAVTKEQLQILERFKNVLYLAYQRFTDITQAETQAREAQIQLALERVRGRTMAMQKSDELTEVAAILFQQVAELGIKAWTTGFNIWSDDNNYYTDYITNPQGGFMPPYTIDATVMPVSIKLRNAKKRGDEFFVNYEEGEALAETYRQLSKFGEKQFKSILEIGFEFPAHQYEHFVFGSKVSLMFITYEPVPESHDIFKRFGKVFEQTYTRFLDLQKAEAQAVHAQLNLIQIQTEKKRAEDALAELRQTQKQLIQSEKMASLGELTAGIAHEIQNPLNFVNNFSETNVELIEELQGELKNGYSNEAVVILNDIKDNESKIAHHGKRADAIVKGMLQHSRKNAGQKEPTDINALCDEYLRLSYHGLRAKDKTFNATLKTFFDETVGKVNIVPQDIGRVLLNLFNNAFYAVHEHLKKLGEGYEPTVWVSTKRMHDKIEIVVKDNGMGISKSLIDKIFQPFYTTKPAGQGTGLGLSLSYDIIKAHGGELSVISNEGEGALFTIQLPLK